MGVFERPLSLGSLKCLETLLVYWQMAFLISKGSVGLILLKVIALVAYLGSWALVAPIIASRFLFDFRPFLLEVIGASNSGPFSFQAHLKSA